ncbi:MAG: aminomethyl-transferring glycine dehydrogenase subunit GcvPB, partial [Bhargavaea sp.]
MHKENQPLIFEISKEGRIGYSLPELDVPETDLSALLPEGLLREEPAELPEASELDIMRHYTALSKRNHGVDSGFYPLGSCTMKYNPKINEAVARLSGFANVHPLQEESSVQGAMGLMYDLQEHLVEITGMDEVTLQSAAGAHGEWTALMMIRAFHQANGDHNRTKVIIPDSAHGTNPASATVAGLETITVKSDENGLVDIEDLKRVAGEDTAALMLTNPNTLGIFDANIAEIARIVHDVGATLYYDGANLNAIMGITRPGDMGFDIVHFNLHKSFTQPHGGGGPGSGPIAVS